MLSCLFSAITFDALHSSDYNLVIHSNKSFTTYLNLKAIAERVVTSSNDSQTQSEKTYLLTQSQNIDKHVELNFSTFASSQQGHKTFPPVVMHLFDTSRVVVFFVSYLNLGFEPVPEIKKFSKEPILIQRCTWL